MKIDLPLTLDLTEWEDTFNIILIVLGGNYFCPCYRVYVDYSDGWSGFIRDYVVTVGDQRL